ncbi:4755_t:CDS:1, partial [Racocetra persica]
MLFQIKISTSNIQTNDPNDPTSNISTHDPNDTTHDTNNKTEWCSHCKKFISVNEFMRFSGSKIKKFAIYNDCAKKGRIEKRKKRHKDILPDNINILPLLPNIETPTNDSDSESSENDLIYNISDLEELIALKFREDELDANVSFLVIVEIENKTVDNEI